MGNTLATDTIPVLVTMVDVHNTKAQDQYYFCNVSSGGAATKVIGRSQTLSVEVGITTVLSCTVFECPEPVFVAGSSTCLGVLRIPIERLAERYSSGIFQQWFNLDTTTNPRNPAGDPQQLVTQFEQAYTNAVADVYKPKICVSVIGSAFEVQRGGRQTCSIFVGEDVKTQAGPDLKALIASHKQQAAYIDALHEELRKMNTPHYRPLNGGSAMPQQGGMPMGGGPGGPMPCGAPSMAQGGGAPMMAGGGPGAMSGRMPMQSGYVGGGPPPPQAGGGMGGNAYNTSASFQGGPGGGGFPPGAGVGVPSNIAPMTT